MKEELPIVSIGYDRSIAREYTQPKSFTLKGFTGREATPDTHTLH